MNGGKVAVTNPVTETKTEVVTKEVDALDKRIQDALTASSTEIEAESQKAYQSKKDMLMKEVELRIRTEYENELKAERIKIEKEIGTY